MPKLQLAILMMMQGAEPICNSVIFPFVNQFVRETGVTNGDERKTGYYAGIVVSIFDAIIRKVADSRLISSRNLYFL